jgi:hypothetical protein
MNNDDIDDAKRQVRTEESEVGREGCLHVGRTMELRQSKAEQSRTEQSLHSLGNCGCCLI